MKDDSLLLKKSQVFVTSEANVSVFLVSSGHARTDSHTLGPAPPPPKKKKKTKSQHEDIFDSWLLSIYFT